MKRSRRSWQPAAPSSERAATILRASEAPTAGWIDRIRDRPVLATWAPLAIFVVFYGAYLYLQIFHPAFLRGEFFSKPVIATTPPADLPPPRPITPSPADPVAMPPPLTPSPSSAPSTATPTAPAPSSAAPAPTAPASNSASTTPIAAPTPTAPPAVPASPAPESATAAHRLKWRWLPLRNQPLRPRKARRWSPRPHRRKRQRLCRPHHRLRLAPSVQRCPPKVRTSSAPQTTRARDPCHADSG